ncbi:MAG: 6-bladed beta-propeller [bacterium]
MNVPTMRQFHSLRRGVAAALPVLLVALVTSCAKQVEPPAVPVFFPPAPELPRIQFLVSLNGRKDVEEQSAFDRFVLGEKPDLKVDKPYGVAIHDGKIYVCDTNSTVFVFDLDGRSFGPLEGAIGPGRLRQPTNISIDSDGTKYVADPVRGQVVVFDADDQYVDAFGTPGSWRPVDVVQLEGRLYVADGTKRLVVVLDAKTGQVLKTIGDKGDPSERLDRPTNLAFDADGYLYVTDFGRFQVLKYDRDGHYKAAFGGIGADFGHFARPKGIALDRAGRLYAVDASFNNVQIFNPEGRLLLFFGESGEGPGGLLLPAKVAIDYDNLSYFEGYLAPDFRAEYLILATSQFGERRVNVFAYGHATGKSYPSDADALKQIEERKKKESAPPK